VGTRPGVVPGEKKSTEQKKLDTGRIMQGSFEKGVISGFACWRREGGEKGETKEFL